MKRFRNIEMMLMASVTFMMLLLVIRLFNTGTVTYFFYVWNIFLAAVPLFFSRRLLLQRKLNCKSWLLITGWMLFLPNAPYVITDLFHYTERPPVPQWFDLLIVTTAAWNGLLLGLVSLMQVEQFIRRHWSTVKVNVFVITSLVLSSYGIYLGRFLRFNSWDIITNPFDLFIETIDRIVMPHEHGRTWGFTLLFGCMLVLMYYSVRMMATMQGPVQVRKD